MRLAAFLRRAPRLVAAAYLVVGAVAASGPAAAAVYHVDASSGADDPARDGLAPATAWKTLTYAVSQIATAGPHEVLVGPGEYSEANGEDFPISIPPDVSITGAGPGLTTFRDATNAGAGTLRWRVNASSAPAAPPTFRDFRIVREKYLGQPIGAALELRATDAAAAPILTNLVLSGASRGLDLYAEAELATTTLSPAVDACRFVENGIGVLSSAYTVTGMLVRADPSFVNCVAMSNVGDGMIFETAASWDIASGQRANALSSPILTHCTMAENLGSGMLLDNSNGYLENRIYHAGQVQPLVTNCIMTGNGDYALHEYTNTTDPAVFDGNLVGGNLTALYKDDGVVDVVTIGGVPGNGNLAEAARFQRTLSVDHHLRGDSPGIDDVDTGFPASDIDGDTRPIDGDGDGRARGDVGADEATACAVDAVLDPAAPADRCGLEAPLLLSAAASAPAPGFTCSQPLQYTWYADGVPFATGPDVAVVPPVTTTYTVVVSCPDVVHCADSRSARVIVWTLPDVDAEAGVSGTPTGHYEACVAWDAADVSIDLLGASQSTEPSAVISSVEWLSSAGVLLGGASAAAILAVTNDGQNQDIAVSFTATDSHGCSATSFTRAHVWRGPRPLPGGPYSRCQTVGAAQTTIPLDGSADLATGNTVTSWSWRTDLGYFADTGGPASALEDPRLVLTNFGFNRTANLTLTVTDDKGCTDSEVTTLTLSWTPNASANGPYQEPEAAVSPTIIPVSGAFTGPPGSTLSWTTTLGTFQSTGTQAADGAVQVLEIANTGTDQLGQLCLTATPPGGTCPDTECTEVSVRTSPPQPPHDIGGSLRIDEAGAGVARFSWTNPPIDATHDRAELFDVWESASPTTGWAPRVTLQDVPRSPGGTAADDASLLDLAGPDLLFLKVVSENAGGFSCADPASQLPDCPSEEICDNGIDDDQDRRTDCEDAGCAGVPPCP